MDFMRGGICGKTTKMSNVELCGVRFSLSRSMGEGRGEGKRSLAANASPQVLLQAGKGFFKIVVVLPVGEIGDAMFTNCLRRTFTSVRVQALPHAQHFHVHQPD